MFFGVLYCHMPLEHGFGGKEIVKNKIEDPITARNKMFDKLLERLPEIRNISKDNAAINPISFIFRNSIQDGLEFARKAGLTPQEIYNSTFHDRLFNLAHQEVAKQAFVSTADSILIATGNGDVYEKLRLNPNNVFEDFSEKADLSVLGKGYLEEYSLPWQDKEIEKNSDLYKTIEDHYREFLPYRANELKESIEEAKEKAESKRREELRKKGIKEKPSAEQVRTEHIKKAENILLSKYLEVLDDKIFSLGETSDPTEVQARLDVECDLDVASQDAVAGALLVYHEGKKSEEALPTFFMKQGGQMFTWDLERARKPVAKIIENISAKKLRGDLESLCNEKGSGATEKNLESFRIIFDEVLGQHIATIEPFHRPSMHESAEEVLLLRQMVPIWSEAIEPMDIEALPIEQLIEKVQNVIYDAPYSRRLGELNAAQHALGSKFWAHAYLQDFIDSFGDVPAKTKQYIEVDNIHHRIEFNKLEGVAKYLADALEKKNNSALTENQIGDLFKFLENQTKKGPLFFAKSVEADDFHTGMTILDALKDPTLENLNEIFAPKVEDELERGKRNEKAHLRDMFKRSKQAFSFVKQMMQDKGRELLRTMGAVPDQSPDRLAEQLVKACFPAEYQAYQDRKKSDRGFGNFFGGAGDDFGLMKNRFESLMSGGNVGAESKEGAPKMSVTLDKPYRGMMVTNVIAHDAQAGNWKRIHIPVDGDMKGNRKYEHVVAKKSNASKNAEVVPTPFGAENIFTNRGTVEKDSLGIVLSPSSGEKLESWSYDLPTGHLAMESVSDRDYTRFLDRLVSEGGSAYLEKIPGLPVECQMFLDSITKLAPRDRVIQIQKFVTSHLFYDAYDNPLREDMNRANVSDRIALMQERMGQIREELGDEVPDGMIFAGVCADATVIGEMMLRASGIAAGAAEGYNVSGNSFNSDHAHGLNVVVWPDSNGKNVLCEVDMTPSAITAAQREAFALAGINPVSVEKTIQESEQMDEQRIKEIRERLDDVIKNLDTMSGDNLEAVDIKQFQENLTDYINATCNLSDVYVFKRMIETYRYTPVRTIENDAQKKVESIGFMQNEYKRWTNDYQTREAPMERLNNAGKNLIGEFKRIRAQAKLDNESDQFNAMIASVPEYLQTSLSAEHKKLWQLLGTYAKALK